MRTLCFALAVTLISFASYAATSDGPDHTFSPTSTRTVSGTEIGHYKTGPVPVDLSTTTIAAFVPNGAGGYTLLPGSGTSSGTFTIPSVPSGFYIVQADQNTTVTFDATYYSVVIFQLFNNGGFTSKTTIATLDTPRTSLLIPQGLLSAGQAYVFKIHTWYVPGINFAKTPFMSGPTIALADVVSGRMQP